MPSREYGFSLVIVPRGDADEIGNEAGDLAFDESVVAYDHVSLRKGMHFEVLKHNCESVTENSDGQLSVRDP